MSTKKKQKKNKKNKKKSSQVFFTIFDVSFLPHFLTTASFTFIIKIKVFCNNNKKKKHIQAAIFGEGKIFGKLQRLHSLDTLWVENFDEITLSRTVKEIEAN